MSRSNTEHEIDAGWDPIFATALTQPEAPAPEARSPRPPERCEICGCDLDDDEVVICNACAVLEEVH